MRVLATSDLHYDVHRSRSSAAQLAGELVKAGGDVLILAGDTAGVEIERHAECLELFSEFSGQKLLVPGNHCIWVRGCESSWDKYWNVLPQLAEEHGFVCLDREPVLVDDVGFVGSMGWYDYSYRDESLGIPERFYSHKIAPGAAAYLPRYEHLVAGYSDVPSEAARIGARWMDGERVKWTFTDAQVTQLLAERFCEHLCWAGRRARTIVAALHHLPFAQMVKAGGPPAWRFANAFMGSGLFGQAMLEQKKCRLAICGHSHSAVEAVVGHVRCVSIGSTYRHKRFTAFDV